MTSRRRRFSVWWKRSGVTLRLAVLVTAALLFAWLVYLQRPSEEATAAGNALLVLVLFNLNIVILSVLAFLIGRNVVKLVFDRKRRILGSKLKLKLVVAFVGLTLIPTSFVFVLASGLLNRAMEGWINEQTENTVKGAVELARLHFSLLREQAKTTSSRLARRLEEGVFPLESERRLSTLLEQRRNEDDLFSIKILRPDGTIHAIVAHPTAALESFREPELSSDAVSRALKGELTTLVEEREANQFVRAYAPVAVRSGYWVVVTSTRVSAELLTARNLISDSFTDLQQLQLQREPLKVNYLLTLAMLTGLLLFSAIWLAFYLARSLVVPIQQLAEGTRAVARGNYDFQVRSVSDDEIGILVTSFNKMIDELRGTRAELEQRRVYLETILGSLAVGVVALDTAGVVTSLNPPARELLGFDVNQEPVHEELRSLLQPEVYETVRPLVEREYNKEIIEREVRLHAGGRERIVLVTSGWIRDAEHEEVGQVLIFDDITDISKMQALSAWREVARRVAHEIKNPLTPIQLSAQRLEKLVTEPSLAGTVRECVAAIVEHVDSIKRLANEFSRFARMPTAEFRSQSLNEVVHEVLAPYPDANATVLFQFIADNRLPDITLDREQIRRVLINLLDNAVQALRRGSDDPRGEGKVTVRSSYDRKRKVAILEVADNGPGIQASDKPRIWDPYFTTKKEGSGLGLAIVNSIVAEHQGTVRVYDNNPRGAKFIIELPLVPHNVTQRRLA